MWYNFVFLAKRQRVGFEHGKFEHNLCLIKSDQKIIKEKKEEEANSKIF